MVERCDAGSDAELEPPTREVIHAECLAGEQVRRSQHGFDTSEPTRAVVVAMAMAASTVQPSNQTPPGRGSVRQGRAWSGT